MSHDPICPNTITNGVRSFWNDECPKCAVIAKARADEREKGATLSKSQMKRIAALEGGEQE